MTKYTPEFKLKVVTEYLTDNLGATYLQKKYDIPRRTVIYDWVQEYQATGTVGNQKYLYYTPEFKKRVVKYAENHSSVETAARYKVFPRTTVSRWVSQYRKYGYDGLISKKRGKQPMGRKRIHPLTPEQEELAKLREKNRQLEMEVAVLKKLDALIQARDGKKR